jgi:hypothetical protein
LSQGQVSGEGYQGSERKFAALCFLPSARWRHKEIGVRALEKIVQALGTNLQEFFSGL